MKILVIGGGGREHALAWRLAQSPKVEEILVAPGNVGTSRESHIRNVAVAATDLDGLLKLARSEAVDWTVVGPEAPLVAGIVDRFEAAGLACFGPHQNAAQLEGSKAFSKDFMRRHAIPTAQYAVFTELQEALAYVREHGAPIVIKADGLAAGKGVVIAMTVAEAEQTLHAMLTEHAFGEASARVVIEECLQGEEASYIVLCDGRQALPMASSQDHKRRDAGDLGPNTGGMGAYSPAPVLTADIEQRVLREIIEPTLAGMAADGAPFRGFLYAGLMIAADGTPQVLEFNVRLGDPETQPIMLRLQSDLVELIEAALRGRLQGHHAHWDSRPALGVVLATSGYPLKPRSGDTIHGLDQVFETGVKVFHAGTRTQDGKVLTAGGRTLTVCALGEDLATARQRAYRATRSIHFEGGFYRNDIATRALP